MKKLIIFDLNLNSYFLFKKYKLLNVKNNIYDLEKNNNSLLYLLENNDTSFEIFTDLLNKDKPICNKIFINTGYPINAKPFIQTSYNELLLNMNNNLAAIMFFIKYLLKNNKLYIIIALHEFNKRKFLIQNQVYNKGLMEFMYNIHMEYCNLRKVYINCLITNKVHLPYKKNIYPYKNIIEYKNIDTIYNIFDNVIKSKFTNKIFKI